MAIRATGQATIIDVTDAYSIILTSEAYTFPGTTSGASAGQKCATQAVAYCGQNQCPVVVVDAKSIICPTGITAALPIVEQHRRQSHLRQQQLSPRPVRQPFQ